MNELREVTFNLDAVRTALHVLAVTVWVGGQIVVGAVVPVVGRAYPGSGKVAAKAFSRVAWPAFAIAVVTGLWSMLSIPSEETSSGWSMLLGIKMVLVLVSGIFALVHQNAGDNAAKRGITAGLALLCSLTALLFGVML
ncbi:CopD family protein [Candidatus Poriferisodalis sp.]|uniref:CopD family protein n=1 Tax=Candidatus Poriferisodalis sp. TaxID=3101277 RepID=UPI003B01D677